MENNLEDENAIDLENLQAQIDLSMSFAQDMVSSWMKASRKLPSRPGGTDNELKEYLKRPPRLGVGAAVPESSVSSRDVARLKGQLSDKKRPRDEDLRVKKESSDDEGESRAGAIKKKARVDPFQGGKKSKDKRPPTKGGPSPVPPVKVESETLQANSERTLVQDIQSTPKKVEKNKPSAVNSSPLIPTSLPLLDLSSMPTPASPVFARRLAQATELLKHPVLNLDGRESDQDASEDNLHKVSPEENLEKKKKRKRRKQKKDTISSEVAGPA